MRITLLIWIDVLKFQVNFDFRGLKGAHFFEVWAPIQGGRLLDISVSRMGSPWNFSHSSIFPSAIKRLESPGWMGIDTHRLIAERCFPGLFEEHVTTRGIYWPPHIFKTTNEIDFRTTVYNHTKYRFVLFLDCWILYHFYGIIKVKTNGKQLW